METSKLTKWIREYGWRHLVGVFFVVFWMFSVAVLFVVFACCFFFFFVVVLVV